MKYLTIWSRKFLKKSEMRVLPVEMCLLNMIDVAEELESKLTFWAIDLILNMSSNYPFCSYD